MSILGIDVSHHQGMIDWQLVKGAGIQFAFLKCTEGTSHVDDYYATNVAECRRFAIPFGSYHFFIPRLDPEKQLAWFLRHRVEGDLEDALDLERRFPLTKRMLTVRVIAWLQGYLSETTAYAYLYSNFNYLENQLLDPTTISRVARIWLSWPAAASEPRIPKRYRKPTFWQYSWKGRVRGIRGDACLDKYMGTDQGFADMIGRNPDDPRFQDLTEELRWFVVLKALRKLKYLDPNDRVLI